MKSSKLVLSILASGMLAGFAMISLAGDGAATPDQKARHAEMKARMLERLKAADTNGDGMISRSEAAAALPELVEHFDKIDADKNGFITLQEFESAMKARHGQHGHDTLKRLDKNGDGAISREEAQASPRLAKHFDEIDTNKDGLLSKEELQAAHAKRREMMFTRIDTDRDGRISQAEAQRFPRLAEHFSKLDVNGDGYISKEEWSAAAVGGKQGGKQSPQ